MNDSSREALDFENKSLGIIDDERTQLLRKWGLEDAVEALAKHGWNSVSQLKIFKRDEQMDELGLPSDTVCVLEILLQSLVTNTLSAPPAALSVAAVTTALQTVSPAAESAAALATPAVVPTAASAASLQTVAPRSTTAAIRAVAHPAKETAAAATTADLQTVCPSAAPSALVATPAVLSTAASVALLRTVAPRSTTSAIPAVAPPATAAAATTLRAVVNEKVKHSDNVRFRIFVEFLNLSSREVLKRYSFQVK